MISDDISDLEMLKADIASRLRSACGHFNDAEFEGLVRQIAEIEVKYSRLSAERAPRAER